VVRGQLGYQYSVRWGAEKVIQPGKSFQVERLLQQLEECLDRLQEGQESFAIFRAEEVDRDRTGKVGAP